MTRRKESTGGRTPETDPLERGSGTAGAMAGEQDNQASGGELGDMNEAGDQAANSTAIGAAMDRSRGKSIGQSVGEKIDNVSGKMTGGIESGKQKLGGTMESTAGKLRERTAGTSGLPQKAGNTLAETMGKTAGYLNEHSSGEIWQDVDHYVREHPTQALVGAALTGLVMARVLL